MPKLGMLALLAVAACAACSAREKPGSGTSGEAVPSASSSSASTSTTASEAPVVLAVIAAEPAPNLFSFDIAGVQSLRAGPVTVKFTNLGTVPHEVRLANVRDGNFDAYKAAVIAQGALGSAPLADELGAAGPLGPGESATSSVALTPGTYALVCFLAGAPDGKTFAQQGMVTELDVTPGVAG